MSILLLKRPFGYSKMDREDPKERAHRKAQFLIYKTLEQADARRRPSFLRIRMCRMKIKIGKRLKKLRRSMLLTISAARVAASKQVGAQLKSWKRLFTSRRSDQSIVNVTLPSLLP